MRPALIVVTLLLTVCALSGCATIFGAAEYQYEHSNPQTGDVCKVRIASRRDVGGPTSIDIGKNCTVKAKAGTLQGGGLTPTEEALVTRALSVWLPPAPAASLVPAPVAPEQ